MTGSESSREGWRILARVAVRAVGTVVGLVAIYYLAPLDRAFDVWTLIGLAVSVALLGLLVLLQARAILRSPLPHLRAIEALAMTVPLLVICFAVTYFVMDSSTFSETLTRTDALYVSVTVFSTVGFGDISAESQAGRAAVAIQIAVNLVALGLGVRVIVGAVERGRSRSRTDAPDR